MVISARTAKKLDFSFCGGSAVEIFERYMSERETQKTAKLQASAVTGFLVWLNGIGETTPTAPIVERYVSEVISTRSKTYAYITTSYLNQFAIFLAKNGFCEVTFWGKKPSNKKPQTKTSEIKALRAITDYYRFLDIEETANQEDIKRAYRRMAIKFHPDQNPDDEYANERFCALQRIYEVLSDTTERYDYDVVMGIREGYKAHPKKYYRVLV